MGFERIDDLLNGVTADGSLHGIAATVVGRDGVLYEGAAGHAGPDTMFRNASMTKTVATTAALQLVEQGHLDLDATVAFLTPRASRTRAPQTGCWKSDLPDRRRPELSVAPDTLASTSQMPSPQPGPASRVPRELAMIRPHKATATAVVVLGDNETVRRCEQLTARAAPRSATIVAMFAFTAGAPASHDDLTEVEAVVAAVARAISIRLPIWMPDPLADLGREQHYRRLSVVLQRHGLDLLVGHDLWPVPDMGGMNEIDHALRREVQAVDALDRAALAAAGVESLERVVEQAANAVPVAPHENDWPPKLPQPDSPWTERRQAVMGYVCWLVDGCGVTRAAAARVLNSSGQRTPDGRAWQSKNVSALLDGRYDREAAA